MAKKRKRQKPSKEKPIPVKETSPLPEEDTSPRGKTEGRRKKKRKTVLKMREQPNWPLMALAGAGMVLTLYLVFVSWLGEAPLFCDEGSSCDIVQQSRWGTLLGLPIALFGFITYTALFFIGFKVRMKVLHWKSAWTVSLIGLGYSVYLNSISLFVIEAACIYCLASLSIMAAIFIFMTFQRPEGLPDFNFKTWATEAIVVLLVVVGGMHMHYSGVFDSGAGPEDAYLKGLAEHLTLEKAVMYGAFW
jgi:uncharacterized membrane protein